MGIEGLKLLREVSDETGLLVITEVMEISQIEPMLPYIDCFQVGARNMQNFNLLRELGYVRKPVLMKRGIAATIEEVLLSAEYILSGGNYDLMLCERGIRTFETYTRNTMDISAIPVLKKLDTPAGIWRPVARSWHSRSSAADGDGIACRWGGWAANGNASQSGQGVFRWRAVAPAGAVGRTGEEAEATRSDHGQDDRGRCSGAAEIGLDHAPTESGATFGEVDPCVVEIVPGVGKYHLAVGVAKGAADLAGNSGNERV